jgi:hypothetical protein
MKIRPITKIFILLVVGIFFAVIYQAIRANDTARRVRTYETFRSVGMAIIDYAKENGHYPDSLSILNYTDRFSEKKESQSTLTKIVYSKPETKNPQKDFILMVTPCSNWTYIFYADGTLLQKNGG